MSADSQHRSKSQNRSSGNPLTVSPQQVTDPTILDSVAGFINDVVPNAYNIPGDCKDQIQWAHFEQLDDYIPNSDLENVIPSPLILVLGYINGIQVWSIPANGEATELFSWKHGSVRVLKLLPTPFRMGQSVSDAYASKRPLIALCDNNTPSPHFCSLSFLSLKTSEQVKVIKFKNPILEVQANRNAIVVTFSERIAVFNAFTLEDRLTVTTCYVSPGIYPNPIALGTRWMAYAENKLLTQKRSSGGNEGEGVQSYTATVIHAAKSLGRGLRELGETVASSLTGNVPYKPGVNTCQSGGEVSQKGIVTVLDVESSNTTSTEKSIEADPIVCHFAAHKEAVVCMRFDPSGLLLLTADKRGHDFHLFRIHPHPGGPSLAAVHHLYVLHRGDTTARVQDMCFSPDSRWVTVSTLRGTTHVFPITSYGGHVGVRTHATPHVVNKMSRFHRSAGLTAEGRSNSPVSLFEAPVNSNLPYNNPRLPPYPHPTLISPMAQIRQPVNIQNSGNVQQRSHSGRQRLGSSSEDNIQVVLRLCACFGPARAWIDNLLPTRDTVHKPPSKPVESLFIMSCHGSLIQYDLDPHPVSSVPKEKVCDDTQIELMVRARAQWILQRQPNSKDLLLPLSTDSLNQIHQDVPIVKNTKPDHNDDRWLSQVEIVTHAGPHRRLWMGPQFTFKTYNTNSGASINILDSKPLDIGRSKPVNMPVTSSYPVLIEAGSVSSCEPSPKLLETCQKNFDETSGAGELQLKEDLADAMLESPGVREAGGGRCVIVSIKHHTTTVAKVVNPLGTVLTVQSDEDVEPEPTEEVIHENCDEALFRPVVASKAIIFAESVNVQNKSSHSISHANKAPAQKEKPVTLPHRIHESRNKPFIDKCKINKSDSLSEVDSGIEKERSESPLFCETTVGKPQHKTTISSQKHESHNKTSTHSSYPKSKSIICDISDTLADMQFVPLTELKKQTFDIITPPPLQKLDFPFPSPPIEDTLISLKTPTDCIEDFSEKDENEQSLKHNRKERRVKNDRYQGLEQKDIVSSSEENAIEEKTLPKKPRKPKTKLGVRIININKETIDEQKDDVSVDFHVKLPKKSWSSVAASKPTVRESPDIEQISDCSSISYSTALKQNIFESDNSQMTKLSSVNILEPEKLHCPKVATNVDLVKLDKSSDEEKVESSQAETTESDDSSKIPTEAIAMDTEEDNCQLETVRSTVCKTNKKKSKKKRR